MSRRILLACGVAAGPKCVVCAFGYAALLRGPELCGAALADAGSWPWLLGAAGAAACLWRTRR